MRAPQQVKVTFEKPRSRGRDWYFPRKGCAWQRRNRARRSCSPGSPGGAPGTSGASRARSPFVCGVTADAAGVSAGTARRSMRRPHAPDLVMERQKKQNSPCDSACGCCGVPARLSRSGLAVDTGLAVSSARERRSPDVRARGAMKQMQVLRLKQGAWRQAGTRRLSVGRNGGGAAVDGIEVEATKRRWTVARTRGARTKQQRQRLSSGVQCDGQQWLYQGVPEQGQKVVATSAGSNLKSACAKSVKRNARRWPKGRALVWPLHRAGSSAALADRTR